MDNEPKYSTFSAGFKQNSKVLFLLFGVALLVLSVVIGIVYLSFQKIALNSLALQDSEFARQTDALGAFTDSMIQQYGMQIFYDPSVARLLDETDISELERVYDLRTLNAFVSSRNFLSSVFVFNRYSDYIYSTDYRMLSAPTDEFADESAVELFKNPDVETRMKPILRVAFPGEEFQHEYYSFMFFETTYLEEPRGSILMLNVDKSWYIDKLTELYGQESCLLIDEDGKLLSSGNPEIVNELPLFLDEVLSEETDEANYIMKRHGGKELVCLYSRIDSNDWYCLRILPLEECLPGLLELRNGIGAGLSLGFALLFLGIGVSLIYLYFPFRHIRAVLGKDGDEADPSGQIDNLLQKSGEYQKARNLRSILENKYIDQKLELVPPFTLLLLDGGDVMKLRELINRLCPQALLDRQHGCEVVLLMDNDALRAGELCGTFVQQSGCRCFCGIPRKTLAELPACYKILTELRSQQFWYAGQWVLSEKDCCCTKPLSDKSREQPHQIMTALKGRDLEGARALWQELLGEVRGSSYVEQLVVFHKMAELLEGALPELKPVISNDFMNKLRDIEELNSRFDEAFAAVVRYNQEQRKTRLDGIAAQVAQMIDEEYADQNLSPASIADRLNMSSAYLGRLFHESLQISISQYINQIRVEKAEELLRSTALPVENIAEKVGFSNPKYFYVVFKNVCGKTPLQYRKSIVENN